MIILGNPEWQRNDGSSCELHFIANGSSIAVVHGDLIRNVQIQQNVIGADKLVIHLKGGATSGLGLVPDEGLICLRVQTSAHDKFYSLGTGQIDYFNRRFEDDGAMLIEIHGRGPLARLIDRPWNILFRGSVADLIRKAGDESVAMDVRGLSERNVRVYIETSSSFAALRLLGLSFEFIIKEDRDGTGIPCRSIKLAREELLSKVPTPIGPDDIVSWNETRGRPVKSRDDR